MSNLHAYVGASDELIAPSPFGAISALQRLGLVAIASLRVTIEDHWAQRRIARFSSHTLRDIGFERDWDGTIRSLRDAD